jgi:hypothetical protein
VKIATSGDERVGDGYLRKKISIAGVVVSPLRAWSANINACVFPRSIGESIAISINRIYSANVIQVISIRISVTNIRSEGQFPHNVILYPSTVRDSNSSCRIWFFLSFRDLPS